MYYDGMGGRGKEKEGEERRRGRRRREEEEGGGGGGRRGRGLWRMKPVRVSVIFIQLQE